MSLRDMLFVLVHKRNLCLDFSSLADLNGVLALLKRQFLNITVFSILGTYYVGYCTLSEFNRLTINDLVRYDIYMEILLGRNLLAAYLGNGGLGSGILLDRLYSLGFLITAVLGIYIITVGR